MKNRLIELLRAEIPTECDKHENCIGCPYEFNEESCIASLAASTADHLLANSVIVPPVNTGDTIYSISTGKLNELRVESISATMYHDRINIGVHATNYRGAFLLLEKCDFCKTVFLTREEAEQALKEREQP